MNREAIYAALFALARSATGIQRAGRKLPPWTEVAQSDEPALFQVQQGENASFSGRGIPTKWTLSVALYLYTKADGATDSVPSTKLNQYLDALTTVFGPEAGPGEQTLGGLVSHARIVGRIETDEGVLGDQALAIVPIEIVVSP